MAPRVRCIAFEQVLGPDRDRYLFAIIDFDDDDGAPLDLFHHSNTLVLSYALHAEYIGKKQRAANIRQRWQPLCTDRLGGRCSRQTRNSLHGQWFPSLARNTLLEQRLTLWPRRLPQAESP